MRTIIKYTFRNIKIKPLRTVVIILCLTVNLVSGKAAEQLIRSGTGKTDFILSSSAGFDEKPVISSNVDFMPTVQISSFLQMHDIDNINSEINDMQTVTCTGNEIADSVLTDKKALAKSCGAEIIVDGSLSGLVVPSVSLCTILANLLDNSIEAVKDLPENRRNIFFTSKRTGNFFYISIKNDTDDFVDVSQEIIPSKKEAENHGLGLRSVKKAVNTCDGALELNCIKTSDGYEFIAEVTLSVKKKYK